MRVTSITVEFECDPHWNRGCRPSLTVTATDAKAARAAATLKGWRFDRLRGYEREACPECAKREAQMVADGITDKRGNILDMARWEALYSEVK